MVLSPRCILCEMVCSAEKVIIMYEVNEAYIINSGVGVFILDTKVLTPPNVAQMLTVANKALPQDEKTIVNSRNKEKEPTLYNHNKRQKNTVGGRDSMGKRSMSVLGKLELKVYRWNFINSMY